MPSEAPDKTVVTTRERWIAGAYGLAIVLVALAILDTVLSWLLGSARLAGALTCGLFTAALCGALARWGHGRSRRWAVAEGVVLGFVGALAWWYWKAG